MSQHRKWHPWRHLREHFPHVDVHFTDLTPLGLQGRLTSRGIELHRHSRQRERRSTLTHEVSHLERGPVPKHPHFALREELVVEEITARRMIPLPDLVDAVLWCQGRIDDETAEELWVGLHVLKTRLTTLTPRERQWVERELARRLN
ncbi:ImmA/IrrE family metallo-endopeptidase [Rhodococcus pyridinivorans]|uniref:ImmA/IrrE family metallo-endopeptidase n=1 Tax=Rhodococcus pyridinivorans TaxID=103816 RepID=A0A7M2XIL8_9NOCA|nr:ImmA/IrrE family metallo-endopeptidase [Rhodococcus pyridinivorans]QOV97202.1 ImmA/IrrE family metallo-endopeptidase [Rhodococcus pyridinivorans]